MNIKQIKNKLAKSEVLEKGKNGDWEKEGYTLKPVLRGKGTHPSTHSFEIHATAPSGESAGTFAFGHDGDQIYSDSSLVWPAHRRKGLASAAYAHAQELSGKSVRPSTEQEPDAKKLWRKKAGTPGFTGRTLDKSDLSKSWEIKVKGKEGYHPVKDIHAPALDATDQGNHYEIHTGEKIHQSRIEDMRPATKKLEKAADPKHLNTIKAGTKHNLGNGYSLHMTKEYHWPDADYRKDSFHNWEVRHKGKAVGELHAWHNPEKSSNRFIDGVDLDEAHRGKGIGKAAYKALQSQYGTIESAYSETSPAAKRVWRAIGAKQLPKKNGQGHKRFILGKSDLLSKGTARKLFPFNPQKDLTEKQHEPVLNWVTAANDQQLDREKVPAIDKNARMRGLNKLRASTETRKDPDTGHTEYKLYRGMSNEEHDAHGYGVTTKTSWTPNQNTAHEFATSYGGGKVATAWIPEHHIHHMPYMHAHDPQVMDVRKEHEVVVNPHDINFESIEHPNDFVANNTQIKRHAMAPGNLVHANKYFGKKLIREKIRANLAPKINKSDDSQTDDLEKAERAPSKHGEKHPTKPYVAQKHTDGKLSWYYSPEKANEYDTYIKDNKNDFVGKFSPEHQPLVSGFIDSVANSYTRHAVPAANKDKGPDVPRARHIRGMMQGDSNYSLNITSPDTLHLTTHERHGDNPRPSVFTFSKVLAKSTDKLAMLRRAIHENQAKTKVARSGYAPGQSSGNAGSQNAEAFRRNAHEVRPLELHSDGVCSPTNEIRPDGHSGRQGGRGEAQESLQDNNSQSAQRVHVPETLEQKVFKIGKSINKLAKSTLEKDAGQIKTPHLEGKFTRPDQQVKQVTGSDEYQKYKSADYDASDYNKIINRHANQRVQPSGGEFVTDSSGKNMPGYAIVGKHAGTSTKHHEGFHLLTNQLVQKHGVDKIHNMYTNLWSSVHPKISEHVENTLNSYDNYRRMGKDKSKKWQLHYLEEKINMLHDMVHEGKDEYKGPENDQGVVGLGRRGKLMQQLDNPEVVSQMGFKDKNHFDQTLKHNWKTLRNRANATKPEDL